MDSQEERIEQLLRHRYPGKYKREYVKKYGNKALPAGWSAFGALPEEEKEKLYKKALEKGVRVEEVTKLSTKGIQ